MTENMLYAAFFFPAAAAVLIFAFKYASAVLAARVRLGQDEAYRDMAAKAVSAQAEAAGAIAAFGGALTEIRSRLAAIEKILKDVE